jgi:hypothetical protein
MKVRVTVSVTPLEMAFLEEIAHSDHSSDGYGMGAWLDQGYFSLTMRQIRGLCTSLQAKGVVAVTPPEPRYGFAFGWVSVMDKFQVRDAENGVGWSGFRFVNLEVNA